MVTSITRHPLSFYNITYDLGHDEYKAQEYSNLLAKAGFSTICSRTGKRETIEDPTAPFGKTIQNRFEVQSELFSVDVLCEASKDGNILRIILECMPNNIYFRNSYINTPEFSKLFTRSFSKRVYMAVKNRYLVEVRPIIANPDNVDIILDKKVLYSKDINLSTDANKEDIWNIKLTPIRLV